MTTFAPVETKSKRTLENEAVEVLKSIFDPEIPVNIYDLGLIYEVKLKDEGACHILMTLTSPNCPVAESLPVEVEEKVVTVDEIATCKVEIVFDPPWDKDMMSEEAKYELGML